MSFTVASSGDGLHVRTSVHQCQTPKTPPQCSEAVVLSPGVFAARFLVQGCRLYELERFGIEKRRKLLTVLLLCEKSMHLAKVSCA